MESQITATSMNIEKTKTGFVISEQSFDSGMGVPRELHGCTTASDVITLVGAWAHAMMPVVEGKPHDPPIVTCDKL